MTTLAQRVLTARKESGLTQAKLAEKIGISQNAIQKIESGQTQETKHILTLATALGVDPIWLANGEGEISFQPISHIATDDDQDDIVLDVLNVEASAGFGTYAGELIEVVSQVRYKTDRYYELFKGMNPNNIQIINVKGDSMQPTFNPGDLLFVDITINAFDGDGIYIFTFDGVTYVKRLQKMGRKLRVISDNRECYDPWDIEGEDLEYVYIHGRVKVHQSQKLNWVG